MVSKKLENQVVPRQCNFRSSIKKNIQESRGTIDQVHSKMCREFNENDILGVQIRVLNNELQNGPPFASGKEAESYKSILGKMEQTHTKGEHDMVEYLLNLGIFLRELEPVVCNTETDNAHTELLNNAPAHGKYHDHQPGGAPPNDNPKSNNQSDLKRWGDSVTCLDTDNKGYKYRKFMSNVCNNEALEEVCENELVCTRCGGNKLTDVVTSSLVCPDCGESSTYMDCTGLHYNMFTDTTIGCIHTYEYKRINHLNDWMSSFQGAESVVISNEIIMLVDSEVRKQRINKKSLKPSDIKTILKKLKLNKYYEHTAAILARVTGTKPVSLPEETQDRIRRMFIQAETTFKDLPNKNRINFLSYSYLLHKFMQLVGRHDLCDYFPLLKSRQKLWNQEQIWKKICEANGWKFIPSM